CSTCRRADYVAYRDAVTNELGRSKPVLAWELNKKLGAERLQPGRGMSRASDRNLWDAPMEDLPDGTVVVDALGVPRLVRGDQLLRFSFDGWTDPIVREVAGNALVLTPRTSVVALRNGFAPTLHPSAG
ncbi:MAG TPA: hypothetical protein VGM78_01555, partial [Ilumatobacteraceae bacterium]